MTDDMLMHRIRAHRSAPDVYDPPTFKDMADRIEELEAQITAMEKGLTAVHMAGYMDGKKAAEAKLAKAMTGLNSIASNTCCDKCQEAALVARTTLAELKGQDDGQAPHAG